MRLAVAGDASLQIQGLKDGNEITSTMKSGEIVIRNAFCNVTIPFILQKVIRGKLSDLRSDPPTHMSVLAFEVSRSTPFTRQGYVSILITSGNTQMYFYIKKYELTKFFDAFCTSAILTHFGD